MIITAEGKDDLGGFLVEVPGTCGACGESQDVVVAYTKLSLVKGLRTRGIDIAAPSLLTTTKGRPKLKALGVTCGCYARFQRQVAHIERKKK